MKTQKPSDLERRKKILEIAKETRKWAMQNRHKNGFPKDLCGMCAIAAMRLFDDLAENGIQAKLAINNRTGAGHCFVLVDDDVIDITATQFGMEPVFVRPLEHAQSISRRQWKISPWKYTKMHDSSRSLQRQLRNSGWPFEQVILRQDV